MLASANVFAVAVLLWVGVAVGVGARVTAVLLGVLGGGVALAHVRHIVGRIRRGCAGP